jgi:hypothetical protein
MTSLYTTLAQNGAVGRSLLDCDECKKPLYMSVCALTRISDGPKTTGFVSAKHPDQQWDERNIEYYDSDGKKQYGVPDVFICPLSQSIMVDPVIASDSHTYEFSWLQAYANQALTTEMISPLTREIMDPTLKVYNNIVLRGMIYEFVQNHGGKLQIYQPIIPRFLEIVRINNGEGMGYIIPGQVSHYTVSDTIDGTFFWACTTVPNYERHNEHQKVFLKGFGPRHLSLNFSLMFVSNQSFISSMEWCGALLYITVFSPDLKDGGLWVYNSSGILYHRGEGRLSIKSSALVQHEDGTLKYILLHEHINRGSEDRLYTLEQRVTASTVAYDFRTLSLVREDIREIGVVGNYIVALSNSGLMKYNQLEYPWEGSFDTRLGTELLPIPPNVSTSSYMVTGSGMFAVFTMTMDRTHLNAIVYDSTGKKLVEGNIPNEPYRREWKDFKAEGRSIMPKSGEDSTFSIFFMASNRLNEVQFVI